MKEKGNGECDQTKRIRSVVMGGDGIVRRGVQIQGVDGQTAAREHNTGDIVEEKPKDKKNQEKHKDQAD